MHFISVGEWNIQDFKKLRIVDSFFTFGFEPYGIHKGLHQISYEF